MPPQIATIVYTLGIAGLFWLDRDRSARPSPALWLPIIWLSEAGSRSLAVWLDMGAPKEIAGQIPESSPLDQVFAGTLMLFGAIVLTQRRRLVKVVLKTSWPIVLYFSFCLISLVWSDFAGWGLKRWARGLGDLIMVLIVATDAQPAAALRRLFSRTGFVLLPASVLLIRYYPQLGLGWDDFGARQFTGVTTSKNVLGDLVFVVGMAALWQVLDLLSGTNKSSRTRHLLAQFILMAFAIYLLSIAHCATATACAILGAALMFAVALPPIRYRPAAVHVLVLTLLLGGGLAQIIGARAAITEALGRKPDLTGRTEIWEILIPLASNPIGGAGFETFWCGPRVAKVFSLIGGLEMTNEAHDGYIEVYLNLGWLGVGLIAVLLTQGYLQTVGALRCDRHLGAVLTAYVITAAIFNISEAGFRMLSIEWFVLLLSIVVASRAARVGNGPSRGFRKLTQPDLVAPTKWDLLVETSGRHPHRSLIDGRIVEDFDLRTQACTTFCPVRSVR